MDEVTYDLVLVGTGFASTFFLHRYLGYAGPRVRVLVLERGGRHSHRWQIEHALALHRQAASSYTNRTGWKRWMFRLAFGGGSNCWWACTPRMLPEDFRLRSLYGVGRDWPVSYDDLEPYYCDAEDLMSVSGSSESSPYPRSRPYPLPPHRFTDPDRLLKRHFPDSFFAQPAARPSRPLSSGRPQCCANGVCHACPIDSKFTVLNELAHLYEDPRVTLLTGANVMSLDIGAGTVRGVRYTRAGRPHTARAELVGLGANALFNPAILLRSGLEGPHVGTGLVEQASVGVDVMLDGVNNFQGSTSITGLGYALYGGGHRRERAAALMETWNVPELRPERGRWRERLKLKFLYEDLPQEHNRVRLDAADPVRPVVEFRSRTSYAERGIASLESDLSRILAPLPVESFRIERQPGGTEAHIQCTTPMSSDGASGVVDAGLIHHKVRNLLVLGSSVFPTAPPANPTLTITALSLRAADVLLKPAAGV